VAAGTADMKPDSNFVEYGSPLLPKLRHPDANGLPLPFADDNRWVK